MRIDRSMLSELLKEQRVAAAAYRAVDQDTTVGAAAPILRRIEREHARAADSLEQESPALLIGEDDAGETWRAWAPAVRSGAHHEGAAETFESLLQGEELLRRDLERALGREDLPFEIRDLIGTRLLPQAIGHIAILRHLTQRG